MGTLYTGTYHYESQYYYLTSGSVKVICLNLMNVHARTEPNLPSLAVLVSWSVAKKRPIKEI